MSYVEDNLMPNEKVLFTARMHPAVFLPAVSLTVLDFTSHSRTYTYQS